MNILAMLLLAASFTLPSATTLVLKTGERIEVSGPIREENGRILFRSGSGTLYSLPSDEIDLKATELASRPKAVVSPDDERAKLRVTEEEKRRLLEELSRNRAGTPAPPPKFESVAPAPSRVEKERTQEDEWYWRNRAREHEEAIRRAKENLALLLDRADRLRSEIATFLSLGYKPGDFTYQTSRLQFTLDAIPHAELEVRRVERAYEQFRDEARQRDVMPGWLR